MKMGPIGWIAFVLTIIGGLNWGLVGAFGGFDLVAAIFGVASITSKVVYVLVGLSALYLLIDALTKSSKGPSAM